MSGTVQECVVCGGPCRRGARADVVTCSDKCRQRRRRLPLIFRINLDGPPPRLSKKELRAVTGGK